MTLNRVIIAIGLSALLYACDFPKPDSEAAAISVPVLASLQQILGNGVELTLEENDSVLIANVAAVALSPDGRILVVDASEGNVKLFDQAGALVSVLGRKGRGPGEFSLPQGISIGPSGQIAVADEGASASISYFGKDGDYRGRFLLGGYHAAASFAWTSDSELVVAALPNQQRTRSVILRMDTLGNVIESYLPMDFGPPPGMSPSPYWASIRSVYVTVENDTAFVTNSLRNTLWTLDLLSGVTRSDSLDYSGYRPPVPPPETISSPSDIADWATSFDFVGKPVAAAGMVIIPLIREAEGKRQVTHLLRDQSGKWWANAGVERLVAGHGNTLLAIRGEPGNLSVIRYVVDER